MRMNRLSALMIHGGGRALPASKSKRREGASTPLVTRGAKDAAKDYERTTDLQDFSSQSLGGPLVSTVTTISKDGLVNSTCVAAKLWRELAEAGMDRGL